MNTVKFRNRVTIARRQIRWDKNTNGNVNSIWFDVETYRYADIDNCYNYEVNLCHLNFRIFGPVLPGVAGVLDEDGSVHDDFGNAVAGMLLDAFAPLGLGIYGDAGDRWMELCSRYYNLEGYALDGDDYDAELARDADRRVNAVEAEAKALLREVIPDFDRLVAEAFVEVEAAT